MNIGFIGCGNMSKSIIAGILDTDFPVKNIMVNDIAIDAALSFETTFGVIRVDNAELCSKCEIIILAVKPQHISNLASQIKNLISHPITLVSILAGVSTTRLKELFEVEDIIRVMPNTAAMVKKSASAMYTTTKKNAIVERIFKNIGMALWVEKESDIDIVTSLSGSGSAYFYTFFEAMIDTAVEMGLDESMAKALCIQTAIGAGILAQNSHKDISTLSKQVTSKGGTTEAALQSLHDDNITKIIRDAMYKALSRAKELNQNN